MVSREARRQEPETRAVRAYLVGGDTGHGDGVGWHVVTKAGGEDGLSRDVAGLDLRRVKVTSVCGRQRL